MTKVYLFDWGDTLMVDFPDQQGPMCNWPSVRAVTGAEQALAYLSVNNEIYVATGAADSTESEIASALERVGLSAYVSGYFCKANLGVAKGSPEFYRAIVGRLGHKPDQIVMVGDTLEKDIIPALEAGLNAIWFNPGNRSRPKNQSIREINNLFELCI